MVTSFKLPTILTAVCLTMATVGLASAQNAKTPYELAKARVDAQKSGDLSRAQPKIIGGDLVSSNKYSFQVALVAASAEPGFEAFGQFCGGTLVTDRFVVTAAHCVPEGNDLKDNIVVLAGARSLPQSGTPAGERLAVDQIVVHEGYDDTSGTNDNDIALIRLGVPASPAVKRAQIADQDHHDRFGFDDADVLITGYGATSEGGATSPDLMRVFVDVKNRDTCRSNYQAQLPSAEVTDNMMCAGIEAGGRDSCQGDSGGFLGAPIGSGNYVLLGVVSWGIGCARPELFGVYTLVANYADWLESKMGEF